MQVTKKIFGPPEEKCNRSSEAKKGLSAQSHTGIYIMLNAYFVSVCAFLNL